MSQHDYNVANAPGATVRADINSLAGAIASLNSGTAEPSVTFAYMLWADTTNNLLKMRNTTNTAWITLATISGSTFTFSSSLFNLASSGSWFGTNARIVQIDTSGVTEIGASLDFHPDAAGTEDYRLRVSRATGANGATTITNSGSGGVNVVPGSGGFAVDGTQLTAIPIGLWAPYGGTSAPTKWLLAYGQNVSRTTYAALFAVYSTTYGVGDGSTTFTLPDLRGRAVVGKDDMGGVSANRLTGLSGGLNGDVLGAAGGAESHTLSTAELSPHTHDVDPPSTSTSTNGDHGHPMRISTEDNASIDPTGGLVLAANGTLVNFTSFTGTPSSTAGRQIGGDGDHTHTVNIASFASASAGSGSAHNNVQPSIVGNYIIYAGV